MEDGKRGLIAALGEPDEESETSCLKPEIWDSLTQPLPGKRLTWRDLEVRVFFTRSPSDRTVLSGWRVTKPRQPPSRYDFALRYDVRLDESAKKAEAKISE